MIEKAEVTALLQQLTAIKSEYFHEDEIMAFARDWLCRQELPAQLHEYHDAKVTDFHGKNVIAVIDGGRPGPVICLNGHLDTVQLCGGWTRDPYGELDGDRLYGVGALDMKSGCAALMVTATRPSPGRSSWRWSLTRRAPTAWAPMPSSRTAISLTWTSPSSPSPAPASTASPSPMSAWVPGAVTVWRSASTESPPTQPTRRRATALCWTRPRWRRPWSRWTMLRTRTWARAPAAWWASAPTAARAAWGWSLR